jgi:nondiscriminating glutamyl-tRNA synthetase
MRLRFAPSPTGHLHVGNARTALYNWLLAHGQGGTFILRIEDTDRERSRVESERAILGDLHWLGLTWDEGPDIDGPHGPYRQSERSALYQEHAQHLRAAGHAYYCFCTPDQLEADRQRALASGHAPKYVGRCRDLSDAEVTRRRNAGEAAALRFRVPADATVAFDDRVRGHVHFEIDVIGDFVMLRSDGSPAYNFAVVVDDGLMGVTDVIRGEDHISNTPRQILLYNAFGWTPPRFAHLALVLGPDHAPLSKRHGATSVAEFRAKGYLPEALANYLALVGWSPGGGDELLPLDELARRFSLEGVSHSAGVFDEEKLAWANRHYLKARPVSQLAILALRYLREAGFVTSPSADAIAYLEGVLPIATGSIDRLDQVPDRLRLIFRFDAAAAAASAEVRAEFESDGGKAVARALAQTLTSSPRLVDKDLFRALAQRVREKTGQKGRALFHPIRVALTGALEGPELDLLVPAIDRGAELPSSSGIAPIVGARERVAALVAALRL